MSKTAEAMLQDFQKLPPAEQQGLLQRLLHSFTPAPSRTPRPLPTVKVSGGCITSAQIADALDDE
jgi:hypothetical protein